MSQILTFNNHLKPVTIMKKFLLAMMVLGSMLAAQGQQNDVWTATLQHGNELTVFRMGNAFVDAYNAAVDGDVITLSEGTFTGVTINKSITIYGAGFENDDVTGTRVSSIGSVNVEGSISNLHIEGCSMGDFTVNSHNQPTNVESICVQNCYLSGRVFFYSPTNTVLGDVLFFRSVIRGAIGSYADVPFTSIRINNCYVGGTIGGFPALSSVVVDHCVLSSGGYDPYYYTNDVFANGDIWILDAESVASNCIFWNINNTSIHDENCYYRIGEGMFVDGGGGAYSADRTWELQQPDVWIGTDGTQIGLHGGQGWSKVPRIPVIKSLNMNVEGSQLKLNFEAEVRE